MAPPGQRARSTVATPEADIELVVRLRVQPRPEAPAREAAPSVEEHDNLPYMVMTRWHTIAANRYEELKKDLAAQGAIESESPLSIQDQEALAKSDQPIRVKVTLLTPLASESTR